jgi:site-specific recombinase XerD
MFTEPTIYNPIDIQKRAFVQTYINGKRFRFYTGKSLQISCFPNEQGVYKDRSREIRRLSRHLNNLLEKGWLPTNEAEIKAPELHVNNALDIVLNVVSSGAYSKLYQRDIIKVIQQLRDFLVFRNQQGYIGAIKGKDLEVFLSQFKSSGTYYMNKRRTLSSVFSILNKHGYIENNPVIQTTKLKTKALLHAPYESDYLTKILSYLKTNQPKLYICGLLMYGCFLRPHQEIRVLKRGDFSENLESISLDGSSNKTGNIRIVRVPSFIIKELIALGIHSLNNNINIFSNTPEPLNESYFNLLWSRSKVKMKQLDLIKNNQTLYSFRHTGAIEIFKHNRDIKLLQGLMGHSNLNTTIIYLRGLKVDLNQFNGDILFHQIEMGFKGLKEI